MNHGMPAQNSDYVKLVRGVAVQMSFMLPNTESPAYRAVKNVMKLTMPRNFAVSDETCMQAALKFVAEAFIEEGDPVAHDALAEFRDIISRGELAPNGGGLSDDVILRLRKSRKR